MELQEKVKYTKALKKKEQGKLAVGVGNGKPLSEQEICRKQFFYNNRFNFITTVITQTLFSLVKLGISFLMMVTIEAIEFSDSSRIRTAIILLVSILISYTVVGFMQKIFRNRYIKTALAQFKMYIFRKILDKSIKEFGSTSSGKIINAFSNDLSSIETNYINGTIQIIQQVVMFIFGMIAMYYVNWVLATCVILGCVIPITSTLLLGRQLVAKERKTSDEGESFVDQVKDLLNGFILIKSFKAEDEVLNLFDKRNFSLEEAKRDRRDTHDTVALASMFSSILVISMIFTIGLFLAFKNIISIGAIIAFVELSHSATGPVERIFPLLNNRKAAIALIDKIAEVIQNQDMVEGKIDITSNDASIEMKNVSFSYTNDKTVLKNINLSFEKGKSYALVGSSGCGKSTLLQLLMGYHSNYNGEIQYGNTELNDISSDSLYDVVSVIQQNVFLFDSSIEDNITMFREFDHEKFEYAVRLAGLTELIEEKGLDYHSGTGGDNLSGGEKQRISIARCLIRETPVLIMDEATASLDNKTAYEIENSILNLDGFTKIIVTHKLNDSIMKQYDEIIVLRDGEVVEAGTFEELMSYKKYLYSLYNVTGS